MAINSPESQPMFPSPEEFQHSEGSYTPPEVTNRRIERLKLIVQSNRKPNKVLDLAAYEPDETGAKSLDHIVLTGEANKISSNRTGNMDAVDYACSQTPERIVRVQSGAEGVPVRGNSAHGVLFLRLGTQRGQLLDVAVKAFSAPSRAFIEYANTNAIRERGIDTLEPIAVIIDKGSGTAKSKPTAKSKISDEPIGYYISAMEPIRSLDRLRIVRNGYISLLATSDKHSSYLDYLSRTGEILAEMHLKGVFPGDAQIKNFAIRQDGSVIPIDFENTDIFNKDFFLTNPGKFTDLSQKGLSVLFGSLSGQTIPPINFYNGYSGDHLWNAFNDTIFSAYAKTYEEIVLKRADENGFNVEQFAQVLDGLETIRGRIKEKVLTPVSSPSKH
ncbi:MAG TPA: hypothetical protein VES68_03135 [Candidatus Sulfotelmatobacter sp.]|nr:hypothetical protein [Candidatus Sulfotelmatobacter sp.]